ncbi:hypothetical protein HYALB_00006151 [Hymenoscyphus albidus]|uniref:Uncharacterized protein n=1 Tax=Hymenoscyphus albidus TaxID=595503 RepID=A0A9N9PVD5_9HELO|nr:hypothetical protein HYALB_00006151 [Hymenoscyphus albidus]
MSFAQSAPQKRPRLSLQIKTPTTAVTFGKSSTALKSDIDPSSPTAFNTLSNAYAAAIENCSPRTARPPFSTELKIAKPTSLRLETTNFTNTGYVHPSERTQTPGPFTITYPDTPSSAQPGNTPISERGENKLALATAFTFTPPQSAGTSDQLPKVFTFDANVPNKDNPSTPRTPRARRTTINYQKTAPYTHPRSLRSILRNSPLPPTSIIIPTTPSRSSLRLANKTAKKVGYNDPLTQTITTNKYVKSHIELLAEDSPYSATPSESQNESLDLALAHTANETRDGGQTPGPFEEMRRRMADSEIETPGAKRRKRKEKKRKWEWTITSTDEMGEFRPYTPVEQPEKTPVTAIRLEIPPSPAVTREGSVSTDSEMSEVEERFVPQETCANASTDSEMSEVDGSSNLGTRQSC